MAARTMSKLKLALIVSTAGIAFAPSLASAQTAPQAGETADAAAADAAVQATDTATAQQAPADEVVVTGFRGSLANALNIKRRENGVVDAISAEDIADFPDLNLAESLQRIPGVAITRRSGEGRQISVRGLGPDYTRVRMNGMEAIATSSGTSNSGGTNRGRGFDFNIFSSDLFSTLVVRKTASADVDEGSLGATVDLNSSKPFDSKGRRIVLNAQGSYNSLARDVQPGISLLASDRFLDGRLGILVSASYDKRHLIEEGANITRWTYGGSNGGWNTASTVPGLTIADINRVVTSFDNAEQGLYAPRIPAYASYDTSSKRLGLSAAIQFRPTDATLFTIEGLHSDFRGKRKEAQLQALGLSRPGQGKPVSVIRTGIVDGNNLVQAVIDNVDLRTQSSRNELNTKFSQLTGTIEHDFGDRAKIKLMGGKSKSKYSDPVATTVTFERIDSDNFSYDFRPRMMEMNLGFDATDPNAWRMVPGSSEVRLTPEWVNNAFTTAKVAGEYELTDAITLKAGADYKGFDFATHALQRANTSNVPAIPAGSAIADLSYTFNFDRGLGLPDTALQSWLAPDLGSFVDAYDIYSGEGLWALRDNVGARSKVRERTTGIYGQADFNFIAFGLPVRGDVGARWFETRQKSGGNAVVGTGVTFVEVKNKYHRILPSANLAVEFTDKLIGRFSVAKTIARPDLGSLSPGGSVTVQGANRNFSTGNPFLKPTGSKNIDLALEWYPQTGAIVAGSFFHKKISTFVQTLRSEAVYSTLGLPNSLLDGTVATPDMVFAVTQPVNSKGGNLSGFEINVQQPLTFLPGLLSNLGVLANYTFVKSNIEYATSTAPGAAVVTAPLIGLSKHAWNGTLYYEDSKFSARVSLAYRAKYLTGVPGSDFNSWQGTNSTTNVDAQVSYNLTDRVRISLEGLNLTDQYADLFVDRDNRLNAYTHSGRQFILSARYSL